MSVEADISNALYAAVAAVVAASSVPAMPIKNPLRTFIIPNNGKYIEIVQIRNNFTGEFWSTGKTYRGTLRVILHWPNNDAGSITPSRYADEIASGFAKGSIFWNGSTKVTVQDEPDAGSMIDTPAECLFPVSIEYQCFYTG